MGPEEFARRLKEHVYHLPRSLRLPGKAVVMGRRERAKGITEMLGGEPLFDGDLFVSLCEFRGCPLAIAAVGIGPSSISIAVQEMAALGVRDFVRIGTCGVVHDTVNVGDIYLVTGAVRRDGVTNMLAPPGFPAVPDPQLMEAFISYIQGQWGRLYRVGQLHSPPGPVMGIADTKAELFEEALDIHPVPEKARDEWEHLLRCGVGVSSMESAPLFIKCHFLQTALCTPLRAATVLVAVGREGRGPLYACSPEELEVIEESKRRAIRMVLEVLCSVR